jgi:hypothetical protein
MPLPAIGAGLAAGKILGGAKGLGGLLKAFYGSKHFITALLGAGYLGSTAVGAYGQAGERGLTQEQMRMQTLFQKASAEATKRGVKESRTKTKEYMKTVTKMIQEERKEARDMAAMQSFQQSQDRQMALVLQAMQSIGQQRASARSPGAGMVGLMRGGF